MKLKGSKKDCFYNNIAEQYGIGFLDSVQGVFIDARKEKHHFEAFWLAETAVGVTGTVLNSICLSIFLIGRDHLLSSVNATICINSLLRLLYTFATQWRNILMWCNWSCTLLFDRDLECYLMVVFVTFCTSSSSLYVALSAFYRYMFVRCSLQKEITKIMKRNSFRAFSFIVGIIYTCVYIFDRFLEHEGPGNRCHFLLYQACMDPTSLVSNKTSSYWTFFEFFIIATGLINISSNIYLFRFLEKKTKNKFELKKTDIKWERQRNLVPVKVGIYAMIMLVIHVINYALMAALKESLVLSTKAWMVAFVSDFYYCIMAPILVLYANPTVWKSIRSVKRTMEQLPFVFTPYIRKNSIMPEATVTIISQP